MISFSLYHSLLFNLSSNTTDPRFERYQQLNSAAIELEGTVESEFSTFVFEDYYLGNLTNISVPVIQEGNFTDSLNSSDYFSGE